MYAFEPSEEQRMLMDVVHRFAVQQLRPAGRAADESLSFPPEIIRKGWELGILQTAIPQEFGGFGMHSLLTGCLALEEMAYGDLAGTLACMTPASFAIPILLGGSPIQKQTYLARFTEAAWTPYTASLIEPFFDFDPNDLRTTARLEGGRYLINGEKINVPFASETSAMIVYANTNGVTQGFIVQTGTTGLQVGERERLLGLHALPTYPVVFENVSIPASERLGGEDGYCFSYLLTSSRLAVAAVALGVARAAYDYARDYAKERTAFGSKIAQKQAIAFMLAEMITEIEAVRLLVWEAAWMADQDMPEAEKNAYLAFQSAADLAMMVTDRAVQILGGHGYVREHPVEKWLREGRGFIHFTGLLIL
jgi:acyl-CoA dehydrogenase